MSDTKSGTVFYVGPVTSRGKYSHRIIVLEVVDNPKYPQLIPFEAGGDRMALLDGVQPGDEATIAYDMRGREWTSPQGERKFFLTLSVWKLDVIRTSQRHTYAHRLTKQEVPDGDDIPF